MEVNAQLQAGDIDRILIFLWNKTLYKTVLWNTRLKVTGISNQALSIAMEGSVTILKWAKLL